MSQPQTATYSDPPQPLAWGPTQAATSNSPLAGFSVFQDTLYCFYLDQSGTTLDYSISKDALTWQPMPPLNLNNPYHLSSINSAWVTLNGNLYGIYQLMGDYKNPSYPIICINSSDGVNWQYNNYATCISDSAYAPAVLAFNFNLYCAYLSTNNPGDIYHVSSSDGITWQPALKIPAVVAAGAPALIEFNGRLFCFYPHQGSDGQADGQLWYTSSLDGIAWLIPQQLNEVSGLVKSPALAVYNENLYCAFQMGDQNNSQLFFTTSSDALNWQAAQKVPDVKLESQHYLIPFSTMLYWAYQDASNHAPSYVYSITSNWPPIIKTKSPSSF